MATVNPLTDEQTPTAEEMIARAEALKPALRARAEDTASGRRVPVETVDDYRKSGLIRLPQPARFGGYEMGWDVLCQVAQVLASADGAQAWIQAIMADHAVLLGTFPEQAQVDVWGDEVKAVLSASLDPQGKAERVAGGYRFSGRFGFSSGVDHADWVICGGFIVDGESRDGPHFFLLPRSDIEIIDDWHTIGLEGTGSKSFEVAETFVPDHRVLDGPRARAGAAPGAEINEGAVYRLPRGGLTPTIFSAMVVGMAQGLQEEWLKYTAQRLSRGVSVAGDPASHIVAGQASAAIASAEALYLSTIRDAMRRLEAGETLSASYILDAKRNAAFAARTALEASTLLINTAGGRAIYQSNILQRKYRDVMAGASHFSIAWESNAMACGRDLIARADASADGA